MADKLKEMFLTWGSLNSLSEAVKSVYAAVDLSTRKYYPGRHGITIIVNGIAKQGRTFMLRVK